MVIRIKTNDFRFLYGLMMSLTKTFILFSVVYDISFSSFESFTSGRLIIAIIFIYILSTKGLKFSQNDTRMLVLVSLLLSLSLIQCLFSNDFTQFSRLFFFLLYGILAPLLITRIFDSLGEFYAYLFIAISVQSLILIFSFITPAFKEFINRVVATGANFTIENIYRAFGFTSSSGAALSLIQSFGVISGLILLTQFSKKLLVNNLILVGIILCLTSTVITGRTGLLVSIVAIAIIIITQNSLKFYAISICFVVILYLKIDVNSMQFERLPDFSFEYFTEWLFEAFQGKDSGTYVALKEMPIPRLNFNTIVGTGKVSLPDGTNASGHDSGYIQTYYSLGILLTILFYSGFIAYSLTEINSVKTFQYRSFLYTLLLLALILEAKEPFIFKYTLTFFLISSIKLSKINK